MGEENMKLAVSNIAWEAANDEIMYALMKRYGFTGLEIAPTRIFPENPYEKLNEAEQWAEEVKKIHGFCIPSIQSIWYGRKENMFHNNREMEILAAYTKKAIRFAKIIHCKNLVFGCPKNRNMPLDGKMSVAISFFKELSDYAQSEGTVIGIEANPVIYHTNFLNDTRSVLDFLMKVDSAGCGLNLDTGTMIQNNESVDWIAGKVSRISHVHVSEPALQVVKKRVIHRELADILKQEHYTGFISVEMAQQADLTCVEETLAYVKEVFG